MRLISAVSGVRLPAPPPLSYYSFLFIGSIGYSHSGCLNGLTVQRVPSWFDLDITFFSYSVFAVVVPASKHGVRVCALY